jgi:hypothetical protein
MQRMVCVSVHVRETTQAMEHFVSQARKSGEQQPTAAWMNPDLNQGLGHFAFYPTPLLSSTAVNPV